MHYTYHLYTIDDDGKHKTIGEPFTNEIEAIHAQYAKMGDTRREAWGCEFVAKYPNGVFIAKTPKK